MAIENLYTYIETDPNNRFTLTESQVTFTGLLGNEDAYLYKDKGASYFSSDLIHLLTFRASAQSAAFICLIWALTNDIDDWQGLADTSKTMVGVALNADGANRNIYLTGLSAGSQQGTLPGYVYSFNTTYFLKVRIDRSVGANGTIYLYTYSDAARATLLDTQSYALSAAQNVAYRYIFAIMSRNFAGGGSYSVTGWTENFELFTADTPVVTQQSLTAVAPTTATGNGTITSIGASSVTEHGHCWNTATAPTTANSKTTNGALGVGLFTSAITGLTAGTKYYVRAYATNTQGTSYSNELSFTSGAISTMRTQGNLGVKGTTLRYVGDDGLEYYIQGTAV